MSLIGTALNALPSSAMSDEAGVNLLLSMSDVAVRSQIGPLFLAQLQNGPSVHGTFFSTSAAPAFVSPDAATGAWVDQVACALVALALGQCSAHGFGGTVNPSAAQGFVDANLAPSNATFAALAMQNYAALFPSACAANGISFSAFATGSYGPPDHWGSVLADHLSSTPYINQQIIKLNPSVDPGDWYQVLFANVYKVRCLNAGEVGRVINAWDPYLHGREQPGIVPWTVYQYMLSANFDSSTFMSQVQAAIAVCQSYTDTLGCEGGPAATCATETEQTYGADVNTWLTNNRGLGFIVGPTNQNVEYLNDASGCCFVPGTPILLADGSTRPIEQVRAGEQVVGRDGSVVARSTQDVIWPVQAHELLYGFNEYRPFFNASHPFMTRDGWKSMNPDASTRMNPGLAVGKLAVGDILLQAAGTHPFEYREVEITIITRMLARDADTRRIYSLHLDADSPGYHAHGFLVAVNYPQLREEQFVRAFAGITDAERTFLLQHFTAIAPFLRRGLGPYIGEILRRALGGDEALPPLGAPRVSVTHR